MKKILVLIAVLALALVANAAMADGITWADSLKTVNVGETFSLDVYATISNVNAIGLAMTFDTAKFDLVGWTPATNFTLALHNEWAQLNDEMTYGYSYEGIFNPIISLSNAKLGTLTLTSKLAEGETANVSFYAQDPNGWYELYTFYNNGGEQIAQTGSVAVTATAVPEAGTMAGFAMSALGLVGTLRRRVRK